MILYKSKSITKKDNWLNTHEPNDYDLSTPLLLGAIYQEMQSKMMFWFFMFWSLPAWKQGLIHNNNKAL